MRIPAKAHAKAPPGRAKALPGPFLGWPGAEGWTGGWAPLLEANKIALKRWKKASDTMAEGMLALSREVTEFAQTRLETGIKNCATLGQCHGPGEALGCQQRFAEAAVAEYLEEANKVTALMTKIANNGFASCNAAQMPVNAGMRAHTRAIARPL